MQTWIRITGRVSISALPRDPPSRLLLHAILFLPFEIESLKLMGEAGIAGIRNGGYYRRIRENLTIHILLPPRPFFFINLLIL